MITISLRETHLYLSGGNTTGSTLLNSPINSIFIRSTLSGFQDTESKNWTIESSDIKETLTLIINHFEKYNINYKLDENSKNLIKEIEDSRNDFEIIKKKGKEVKLNSVDEEIANLRKLLKNEFKRELTNKQFHSLSHLIAVKNGANFSVPGSGKTSIVIAYFHILRLSHIVEKLLVIGPASCFVPWESEYNECLGVSDCFIRLAGVSKRERKELYYEVGDKLLLLTTYHSAANDLIEIITTLRQYKCLVVLDESHYIKKPGGGKLVDAVLKLSKYATRRIVLTGTPMPNNVLDLWSQITYLWPRLLPLDNVQNYARELKSGNKDQNIKYAKDKIDPLFFRITKKQLDLPDPVYLTVICKLSPIQKRIYGGIAEKYLSHIHESPKNRDELREWRKARFIRLLQVAVNPSLLIKSCTEFTLDKMDLSNVSIKKLIEHYSEYEKPEKIIKCCEIARDVAKEHGKIIIWSSFVHNLHMLANELKDLNPVVIYGGVPYSSTDDEDFNREKLIEKFRFDKKCKVFIANPAACAESISLHKECHNAIYLDRSFNCAHYLQSLDRIHRLGLKKTDKTNYYLLLAEGTIDECVNDRLDEKIDNMNRVLEGDMPAISSGYWEDESFIESEKDDDIVTRHLNNVVNKNWQ